MIVPEFNPVHQPDQGTYQHEGDRQVGDDWRLEVLRDAADYCRASLPRASGQQPLI